LLFLDQLPSFKLPEELAQLGAVERLLAGLAWLTFLLG
jgi:hypothetical protein